MISALWFYYGVGCFLAVAAVLAIGAWLQNWRDARKENRK
jgi:hypothetical protein